MLDAALLAGNEATMELSRLLRFPRVTCEQQGARDRYGRVVARCSTRGFWSGQKNDLSASLVGSGHAVVYRCPPFCLMKPWTCPCNSQSHLDHCSCQLYCI